MKKILIIYPHFPPSNLAGVHRPRLFAQHLPSFGWEPVILTVNEKYYEEEHDWNLVKLLSPDLRIEKVNAFPVKKFRVVGDIGLRAFFQLYKRAKRLLESEKFDFLLIPVPSFYCALLGRWLHHSTGIRYGIDYIDPWVHRFPGSEKKFSRHWFSSKLAGILEPVAIKKASLITGVAEGYFSPVLERNPYLKTQAVYGAMPYGGERKDNQMLSSLNIAAGIFKKEEGIFQFVYAGALLPKSFTILEAIFKNISNNIEFFRHIKFHFIGTGKTPSDPEGFNIKPLAIKYGIWQTIVYEYPKRIPYLQVLVQLQQADGFFILGSTESHYTPSKVYQGVLSGLPVAAILHQESTATNLIHESGAGKVLAFNGEQGVSQILQGFTSFIKEFMTWSQGFSDKKINTSFFDMYTARSVTQHLVSLINKAIA